MPSEKGRIVAGNQEAIRRLFKVTRVSTGNMPTLPATFPNGIAPVGGTGAQWPDSRRRYPEGIAASLLVTMGDGWLWRKPNRATLLAAGAAAQLQLLYPPRLRRGLVAISGPLIPLIRKSATAGAFLDGVNVASVFIWGIWTYDVEETPFGRLFRCEASLVTVHADAPIFES